MKMLVIVAGAGLIGTEITKMLVSNRHDVVVIDIDREVCESLYAETGAMSIHGSATDIRVLEEAGLMKADALLCLMRNDADNIACSLIAKTMGVPRILARLRDPRYEKAYELAGVTTIVRMADLLLNQIMTEIEQPKVKKIMVLGGGKAEVYAVTISEKMKSVGLSIKEITEKKAFPKECVFMGVYRAQEDEFHIPRGNYVIKAADTIFLVSTSRNIKQATDFLTRNRLH